LSGSTGLLSELKSCDFVLIFSKETTLQCIIFLIDIETFDAIVIICRWS